MRVLRIPGTRYSYRGMNTTAVPGRSYVQLRYAHTLP